MSSRFAKFAAALTCSSPLPLCPRQAQDFPTRPIRMVIAFPPGGPTDFVGRLLADKLKDSLSQPVLIENKPGANGAIGADFVAKAEPDGHTIFLSTVGAIAITPHMRTDLPYNTLRDFAPVTLVVRNTTILVVRADHPANSAKDLAALAKAKPGAIPFASTGVGSTTHLALELYQTAAGIKFVHVPYRGAAPALTDLLGGQVEAFFADATVLMPQIRGGKVKPLGAASSQRNPLLPNVPTLRRTGLSGYRVGQLVWAAGAGQDPASGDRQAQCGLRRRDQRSGRERQADPVRRGPGGQHAGRVRQASQGRAGALGQRGARPRASRSRAENSDAG